MFTFLLVLLILDGILLSVIVLLQSSKGDGLAAMGGASMGTDSFIGGRQAATLLTKASWVTGGLFLGLAFLLSILSSRQEAPRSILRDEFQQTAPAAPRPVIPGVQPAQPATGATPGATGAPQGAAPATPAPTGQAAPAQPAPAQPKQ